MPSSLQYSIGKEQVIGYTLAQEEGITQGHGCQKVDIMVANLTSVCHRLQLSFVWFQIQVSFYWVLPLGKHDIYT